MESSFNVGAGVHACAGSGTGEDAVLHPGMNGSKLGHYRHELVGI